MNRRAFVKTCAASVAAVAFSRVAAPPTAAATGSVTTNDGVTLRYEEAGSGKPLVCIPGWSQTAAQFKHQLSGLSDRYRVMAVDMRGHGESDKPDNGYTIQRLAKDVQDLLIARNLTDVTLMGHSMGSSVIWRSSRRCRRGASLIGPPTTRTRDISITRARRDRRGRASQQRATQLPGVLPRFPRPAGGRSCGARRVRGRVLHGHPGRRRWSAGAALPRSSSIRTSRPARPRT